MFTEMPYLLVLDDSEAHSDGQKGRQMSSLLLLPREKYRTP